ncbi:hypothetical protein Gotur_027878, partial [Gossypium turneri]
MKLYKSFVDGGRKLELTHLEELNLNYNLFNNSVFASLKLSNLKSLSIIDNQLKGSIDTKDVDAFTNLRILDMSNNEYLKDFVIQKGWCDLRNLEVLDVSENALEGMLPHCFSNLTSLRELDISGNHFQIPLSFAPFANLSNLKVLLSDENKIVMELSFYTSVPNGIVPTWLLENNTKLEVLFLRGNSFTGPVSLPPTLNINLSSLDISQNILQGNIPCCLSDMKHLSILDLSNNQLSGRVPEELITKSSLTILRLSNNNLSGNVIPMIFNAKGLSSLYLDGNNFSGEMTNVDVSTFEFPPSLREINLGNNNFYGNLPRWIGNVSFLERLALSQNDFKGSIPMEFCNLNDLEYLDLSENNLFGSIPSCFSSPSIKYVHLHENRLSGPLPIAFYNSSSLVTLDLRGNNLTGSIPKWIGTLSSLSVLLLKDNNFHGRIPVQLCKLYSLSIIDLSQNMFSGLIPSCLGSLTLPMEGNKILDSVGSGPILTEDELMGKLDVNYFNPNSYVEEVIEFTTKSGFYSYGGNILAYMSGIDLSCNNLTGHIPPELGNLSEIYSLNLSHNKLTGVIPSSFSKLQQIESLDLSYNNLSGEIPNQLVELNSL